ncbi:hypothetical protein [Tenacibaculum maritimum]|uniref:hypothetical protein n=1 Tax=Tenacibaculum maritimum TaxID=107401 RepID=UPI0012E69BFE|nr:hypothetical protein [Tenacibaculum maritimum]CAA0222156.1 conserved membrane hypothetical protein [Tenacibaculum maritimum]
MKKAQKLELYESLTSMNSLSYSIISYGIFYGIKQAAFFYALFAYLISNEYLRIIPSLFFGYFISRAMLDTSSHISEKKEWVIISISFFDFLILCVITDVLGQDNWKAITKLIIFCAFVTYLGFWLTKVFVDQAKQRKKQAAEKQKKASKKEKLADIEQQIAQASKELAEINNTVADQKQKFEKLEQEVADRSCPHCHEPFPSKKARDAHKGRCKQNPKNKS